MNIPQIQIHQTFGQIGLRYQPSDLEIQTPPVNMALEYTPTDLELHSVPGDLQIDQSQAFSDEGLNPPLEEAELQAHAAEEAAEQGVANTAAWAESFVNPKSHASVSAWLSRYQSQVTLTPTLVPSPFSVKVHYTPGHLESNVQLGSVHPQVHVSPVSFSYQPAKVQVYTAQENRVSIGLSSPQSSSAFNILA